MRTAPTGIWTKTKFMMAETMSTPWLAKVNGGDLKRAVYAHLDPSGLTSTLDSAWTSKSAPTASM
mgnify:CR=1 FL=1